MLKYIKILKIIMNDKGCYGSCINSFDENGESLIDLFSDVSDFAYVEENSLLITLEEFVEKVGMKREILSKITKLNECDFLFNSERSICMLYNKIEDVHYFFIEQDKLLLELTKYIPEELLNKDLIKYKDYIIDYFKDNKETFIYGQKRDNCGVIAGDFSLYMKNRGIKIERVKGDFLNDKGSFKELDFYKEELIDMKNKNLNPKSLEDRIKYCDIMSLQERQKKIPHYWNVDENGIIIDLSGYSQFVKTKMSKDLNFKRYIEEEKPKLKNNKIKI